MAEKKKTKKSVKKISPKKTKKEKVTEIFEIEKGKKEKTIKTKGTEEVPIKEKNQLNEQKKILRNFLIGFAIIIGMILGFYFYTQSQIHIQYKGIEFQAKEISSILFYETTTLLESNDDLQAPFGFRIRTNPNELKKIPFENIENFELMRLNAYSYGNGTFNCEGDGVISMPNMVRVFQKAGMEIIHDENATCDQEGRYNFFQLKYGDKTEIKELGTHCYEVIIKGNDDQCEILPATEKLMVEIFAKYKEFLEN